MPRSNGFAEASALSALRVVLDVSEVAELRRLREENARLSHELSLWKADTEVPQVGEYYFSGSKELLEFHGWTFYHPLVALRYEGAQWETVRRVDGTTKDFYRHIFLAPYEYDEDDSRTGWIKFGFESWELHQLCKIDDFKDFQQVVYLDHNDCYVEWDADDALDGE